MMDIMLVKSIKMRYLLTMDICQKETISLGEGFNVCNANWKDNMKIKWKKLGFDSLLLVTFPLWIIPAIVIIVVFHLVDAFIEYYTEQITSTYRKEGD